MENFNRTAAERIKYMRIERGYTIRDLSIKTDIAEASLSGYEHGKKGIGLKSLISLADALNVSLDYLTGRSEEPFIRRSVQPSGQTQGENRAEDGKREQFLKEMRELFDKYISSYSSVDNESPESRERAAAVEALKTAIKDGEWQESLWSCIKLHQGVDFKTAGRGKAHTGSTAFTYRLKRSSRTGELTDELIISTRERGKSITRSSVELALSRYLAVQEAEGMVRGPKSAGQVFGASYLYSVFVRWGVIKSAPSFSD